MPEQNLSAEEAQRITFLLNNPEDPNAAIFQDPAVRAQAEQMLSTHVQQNLPNPQKQFHDISRGPGLAMANFSAGAEDTIYGLTTLAMDGVLAVLPEDSGPHEAVKTQRDAVNNFRRAAEYEHDAFVQSELGEQLDGASGFLTKDIPTFVGEILPIMYAPTGLSTYWRTVGYNGIVGGVAASALDKEAENLRERIGELSIGGLAGVVVSGALHAPGGFRAYAARKMRRKLETDLAKANRALEADVQRMTGDPTFTFSLGEITGNPFIIGLEIGAAKEATRASQNTRIKTLINFLKVRSNQLSETGNVDDIAIDLNQTLRDINKLMQKRASNNYSTGMENVAIKFGEEPIIDGRHYLSEIQRLAAEYSNPALGGSEGAVPQFLKGQIDELSTRVYPATTVKEVRNGVETWVVRRKDDGRSLGAFNNPREAATRLSKYNLDNGGIEAEYAAELMQGFRRIAKGDIGGGVTANITPGSAQNLSLAMKKAMNESLDGNVLNRDAVEAIKSLRKIYQFDQAQITGINNRLLGGLFGVDDISALNAKAAFNTMVSRSPKAQRAMAGILEELNPALLDDIRAEQMSQWVRKSYVPDAPQSMTPYSPVMLARQLAGEGGAEGAAARGLFDPKDALHLKRTGQALRTINETYLSVFPEASGSMVRDASINIVSRSPEFFARWMTGLFSQGKTIERMLQDPAFRDSIITVAERGLGTPQAQAAMIYMAVTAAEWAAGDQKRATEEQEEDLREIRRANPRP